MAYFPRSRLFSAAAVLAAAFLIRPVLAADDAPAAASNVMLPQTATVSIAGTKMEALQFDGDPRWVSIDGTTLSHAANTPTPVIRLDSHTYYALQNAVWFVASAVSGPWVVATSVPASIYSIPPNSPLHYVTFVRIFSSSGGNVQLVYTPGYPYPFISTWGWGYPYFGSDPMGGRFGGFRGGRSPR